MRALTIIVEKLIKYLLFRKRGKEMDHFHSVTLLKAFITRLEKDEITFLKNSSSDKTAIIEEAKNLVTILATPGAFDFPETEKLEKAKILWEKLVINALRHISISMNARGFDRLRKYYKKHVEFEDILFGIDPTYRDHTMHALWVYLLGDYIMNDKRYDFFLKFIDWGIEASPTIGIDDIREYKKEIENSLLEYTDSVYCIIALCHDLAYPYEKAEKVNKRIEEMIPYLGMGAYEALRYQFSMEQSLLIKKLIELISQKPVIVEKNNLILILDDPTFVDMSQSFEQRKHGILSSYLLYRLSDTIGEIPFSNIQNIPGKEITLKHFILRRTILHAISSHTCDYAYSSTFNRFRFLLCLVDELEEFSRYSRKKRGNIDEICKSGLEYEKDGKFTVDYTFEKYHEADPLKFFASRAIRFTFMVDINEKKEHGIRSFHIKCNDKTDKVPKCHELKIDASGIHCRLHGSAWEKIDPDPQNKLQDQINNWKK